GTISIGDLASDREYSIVADLDGYETRRAVVHLDRGDNELALELQALAIIDVDSQPPGAAIRVDGKVIGSTPSTLTALPPGATVSIALERAGYVPATVQIIVPERGKRTRIFQSLELSDAFVRVHFVSLPPGAQIVETGTRATVDRTYTPAELVVEANKLQR